MSAGIACGIFKDAKDAAEKCVKRGAVIEPNPEMTKIYRKKYNTYRKIEASLGDVWKDVRGIKGE